MTVSAMLWCANADLRLVMTACEVQLCSLSLSNAVVVHCDDVVMRVPCEQVFRVWRVIAGAPCCLCCAFLGICCSIALGCLSCSCLFSQKSVCRQLWQLRHQALHPSCPHISKLVLGWVYPERQSEEPVSAEYCVERRQQWWFGAQFYGPVTGPRVQNTIRIVSKYWALGSFVVTSSSVGRG